MRSREAHRVAERLRRDGLPARVACDEEDSSKNCWVYFEQGPWSVHVARRTRRGQFRILIDHDDHEVSVFFVRTAAEISGAVKVAMVLAL